VLSKCALNTAALKAAILNNVDVLGSLTGRVATNGRLNMDKALRSCFVPAAPTHVTATGADAKVALAWTASGGATSYNVYRRLSSGTFGSPLKTGITATSYTNTGLTNGTTYYYVVSAVNSVGESANSSPVSATPSAAPAAAVFSDDFETGNLSKWTSSGGLVTQTARVHGGTAVARHGNHEQRIALTQPMELLIDTASAALVVNDAGPQPAQAVSRERRQMARGALAEDEYSVRSAK